MGGKTNIKQRLTYIDIARAIGILFVVLGHINQFYRDSQGIEYSQILIFIYAFHMPLFFILSGILFSEKTFRNLSFFDFLIKKVKGLVVPYLFLDITAGLYGDGCFFGNKVFFYCGSCEKYVNDSLQC